MSGESQHISCLPDMHILGLFSAVCKVRAGNSTGFCVTHQKFDTKVLGCPEVCLKLA
jgi:hypothetical protein